MNNRRDLDFQAGLTLNRRSFLNTAASGRFSSDRTIREYNDDIWRLEPGSPAGS